MIDTIKVAKFSRDGSQENHTAKTVEGFDLVLTNDEYARLIGRQIMKRPLEIEREVVSISLQEGKYFVKYEQEVVEINREKYNELYNQISQYSLEA